MFWLNPHQNIYFSQFSSQSLDSHPFLSYCQKYKWIFQLFALECLKNFFFTVDELEKGAALKMSSNLTTENLEKLNSSKDLTKSGGSLTQDKLNSIISFLDEVQVTDRLSEIDTVSWSLNISESCDYWSVFIHLIHYKWKSTVFW